MNTQVSFLDGELSLVHIPLDLYSIFLQPILQILLPQAHSLSREVGDSTPPDGLTADYAHSFLNVSVTPVECSIVCHTHWAKNVLAPVVAKEAERLPRDAAAAAMAAVSISEDAYIALCVLSGGMDAGSRVVDLSSPLALAGIPIFFVTTYYADFILVPSKDRQSVVQALLSRGFEFSELESSFVSPGSLSHPQQAHAQQYNSMGSSTGSIGSIGSLFASRVPQSDQQQHDPQEQPKREEDETGSGPPPTPPPSNAAELQDRTFKLLRKRSVVPYIVPGLRLAHCSGRGVDSSSGGGGGGGGGGGMGAGSGSGGGGGDDGRRGPPQRRGTQQRASWLDTVDARLYTCLVAALALPPRFLSLTLAAPDLPSVLLDKTLLPLFGNTLVGDVGGDLVPIFLDLVALPFEATGIVSGVAGKLVTAMHMDETPDLSYLSTSKAGAVILADEHAQDALRILLETTNGGEGASTTDEQ